MWEKLYSFGKDLLTLKVLATGWDKQHWINAILFHAHLVDRDVIIEEDNFEDGLTSQLIAAGIDANNIRTSIAKQKVAA
jgi:hypothetical protein